MVADDGTPIAYTVRDADGPEVPLLFASGWSCSDAYWGKLLPLLEAAGHPCLLPDTRGHGARASPARRAAGARNLTIDDLSMPRIARDLLAVLDDAGRRATRSWSATPWACRPPSRCTGWRPTGSSAWCSSPAPSENPAKTFYGTARSSTASSPSAPAPCAGSPRS